MSTPTDERVGTVTFNYERYFDIPGAGELAVPPGDYPIYRTPRDDVYWVMVGQPFSTVPVFRDISPGLFTMHYRDVVDRDAPPVVFQSLLMTWDHITAEIRFPTVRDDGTPYYRIRLDMPA